MDLSQNSCEFKVNAHYDRHCLREATVLRVTADVMYGPFYFWQPDNQAGQPFLCGSAALPLGPASFIPDEQRKLFILRPERVRFEI